MTERYIYYVLINYIFCGFRLRIILHFITSVSMSELVLQHLQQGEMISEETFLFIFKKNVQQKVSLIIFLVGVELGRARTAPVAVLG